eukprot:4716514-Prymnesium_polylepis.1
MSAIRMYHTFCDAGGERAGGRGWWHQTHTCFRQMCAALRDREVLHDLVVCAAFGCAIEDFATRRWCGRSRPTMADLGGFGRLARKTEIIKNERCTIRKSPSNTPCQALQGTHRQIPQRRDLHTVAGGLKPHPISNVLPSTGFVPISHLVTT